MAVSKTDTLLGRVILGINSLLSLFRFILMVGVAQDGLLARGGYIFLFEQIHLS